LILPSAVYLRWAESLKKVGEKLKNLT